MSIPLATMRDQVALVLGGRTDVTTAMMNSWLNQSQLALASRLRVYEIEAAATFVLSTVGPNNDIYSHPTNFWAPILLVNTSDKRGKVPLKPIETILVTDTSIPSRVTMYGIRGKTFVFRPLPNVADILELTYKMRPATMTDSVDMTLPDEFEPAVVFDAIVRGLHLTGDEDRAEIYRNHRNDALGQVGDARGEEFALRQEGVVVAGLDPAVRLG